MIKENQIWQALKQVFDPELNFSVVDLGLIYKVGVTDSRSRRAPRGATPGVAPVQDVKVEMTLTTPFCPYGPALLDEMKQQLGKIKGIGKIEIEVVWEPPWDTSKLSPEIKTQLGFV